MNVLSSKAVLFSYMLLRILNIWSNISCIAWYRLVSANNESYVQRITPKLAILLLP